MFVWSVRYTCHRSDCTPLHNVSWYVLIPIPFSLLCVPIQQCKVPCPISLLIFFLKSKTTDQSRSDNAIGDMEEEVEMVGRVFVDHIITSCSMVIKVSLLFHCISQIPCSRLRGRRYKGFLIYLLSCRLINVGTWLAPLIHSHPHFVAAF